MLRLEQPLRIAKEILVVGPAQQRHVDDIAGFGQRNELTAVPVKQDLVIIFRIGIIGYYI